MRNPKIGETLQMEFFEKTSLMSREETIEYCTNIILEARAPNYTLINQFKNMGKNAIVVATNNFIMKGQGFGV